MSEWTWVNDQAKQSSNRYLLYVLFLLAFTVIYDVVFLLVLSHYVQNSAQFVDLLIVISIMTITFLSLIIYYYSRIRLIRKAIACLKKIEIRNGSIILNTVNGIYVAKLSEVYTCYKAIIGRNFRPSIYRVFIVYRGFVYEVPELRPEDFGALRQVLRGYGMDLNECTDDLSRYVCISQSQQW